ncbi:AraC family transcriptional regulator [Thomasclavelia sp.]|uniref:AraC family transcriptional regulator n=1 Tax=Thomasclavelia sp. TaxID=3025757 RepID=UPI0025F401B2|nr:AraC family transcriptional regulator [Thomasclavelia sp.]
MYRYEKIEHDHNLPTKLLDFYLENCRAEIIEKHWHRSIEILIPLYGSFELWVNGNILNISAGQIYIVNSKLVHRIVPDKNPDYYKGYALQINYDYLKNCYHDIEKIYFRQPNANENKIILTKILEIISHYERIDQFSSIRTKSDIMMLVYLLLNNLAVKKSDFIEIKDNKQKKRIVEITRYIDENYNNDLSAALLSEKFGFSQGYLYKLFKDNFDMSLKHYINSVRLNHAKEDLVSLNYPIIDIAIINGFPNVKSFNQFFKQKYGITPAKYREKMRK